MEQLQFKAEHGVLYVVATPLGNLGDISRRAIDILSSVDLIAAEDTRHSQRLLTHLGLKKTMRSLHAHNEAEQSQPLIERLKTGESIALVSDAGTPLISDPGFPLLRAAREQGIRVCPIPGPSALITALSAAGLPCDRFCFEGFLPAKNAARREVLGSLVAETRTLVFYESTHRIVDSLKSMSEVFGHGRVACIARELTKTFEEIHSDELGALLDWLISDDNHQRGEFVVIVAGADCLASRELTAADDHLLVCLLEEMQVKPASKMAAKISGKAANAFYQRALALKNDR